MISQVPRQKLKIDKHLPQIVIPPKTRTMFINWWNSDIRFEKSIPRVFEKGYIILEYNYVERQEELLKSNSSEIKHIAKFYHCTYREAETMFKNLLACFSKLTLYFHFISENTMKVEMYDSTDSIVYSMEFAVGESEPEPELLSDDILFAYAMKQMTDSNENNNKFNLNNDKFMYDSMQCLLCIVVTAFWYIATTKSTKYIYENKTPVVTGRKKGVVTVSDTKTINTPIYDLNKIRIVKVEHLQSRKKGWTYSHSFQVHGHYRHYKNGKTIFIEPFIKGKDKEFKPQTIIVEPKH